MDKDPGGPIKLLGTQLPHVSITPTIDADTPKATAKRRLQSLRGLILGIQIPHGAGVPMMPTMEIDTPKAAKRRSQSLGGPILDTQILNGAGAPMVPTMDTDIPKATAKCRLQNLGGPILGTQLPHEVSIVPTRNTATPKTTAKQSVYFASFGCILGIMLQWIPPTTNDIREWKTMDEAGGGVSWVQMSSAIISGCFLNDWGYLLVRVDVLIWCTQGLLCFGKLFLLSQLTL